MMSKKYFKPLIAAALLVPCLTSFAGTFLSVTKSQKVTFPSEIMLGHIVVGDYIVKNNSTVSQPVYLSNIPTGFKQIPADDSPEAAACSLTRGFQLSPGASCAIRLKYASTAATTLAASTFPSACINADGTGCTHPTDATGFTVTATPAKKAELSSDGHVIAFTPAETTEFKVINNSNVAANNVSISLPENALRYLSVPNSVTSCSSIPANGACTMKFVMLPGMPKVPLPPFVLKAGNAGSISLRGIITDSPFAVTGAEITKPGISGVQSIYVNNGGSKPISGLSIALGAGLHGVTPVTLSSSCGSTLQPYSSCVFAYEANQSAYGSVVATVSFTAAGSPSSTRQVGLSVGQTKLVINPGASGEGQDIQSASSGGSFVVANTGVFNAQLFKVQKAAADTWFNLDGSDCPAILGAGQSCSMHYGHLPSTETASAIITATASNADPVSQNFYHQNSLQLGVDGTNQHLGYEAVRFVNNTAAVRLITDINANMPASSQSKVVLCAPDGSNCDSQFASTCVIGKLYQPGAACRLWYKAVVSTSLVSAINIHAHIAVSSKVEGTTDVDITPANLAIQYHNAMYYSANATGLNDGILQGYDGSTWKTFAVANTRFHKMIFYAGDIYAGVAMSTTTGQNLYAGLINVTGTNAIQNSPGNIDAMAVINNKLVVGGQFDNANGVDNTARLAKYDAVTGQWSALGTGIAPYNGSNNYDSRVSALVVANSHLFVGGDFDQAGDVSQANSVAYWNPINDKWSAMGVGVNGVVKNMHAVNGRLYVNGFFTNAFNTIGGPVANTFKMAAWDYGDSEWKSLGVGNDFADFNEMPGAMQSIGNTLYTLVSVTDKSIFDSHMWLNAYDTTSSNPVWSWTDTGIIDSGIFGSEMRLFNMDGKLQLTGSFSSIGASSPVAANSIAQYAPASTPPFITLGAPNQNVSIQGAVMAPSIDLNLQTPSKK